MHSQRTKSARAAAVLTLALSTPLAADEHPLIGTWEATWPNGLVVELTVTKIDDQGAAHGIYWDIRRAFIGFTDLHPDEVVFKQRTKPKTRLWRFTPSEQGGAMHYRFRDHKGKTHTLDLERGDPACVNRVEPQS